MKRKALALTFIMALLLLTLVGNCLVEFARANPEAYDWFTPPNILIHSPVDNSTVVPSDASINFTITKPDSGWLVSYSVPSDPQRLLGNKLSYVSIIIDGKLYRTIETDSDLSSPLTSYQPLANLEDGEHNLTIKAYCEGWELEVHGLWERSLQYNVTSDFVDFAVDSTAPFVTVLNPENKSYESSEKAQSLTLNFTINEAATKIMYSLDGHANITVAGNTTLTNLTLGEHTVRVYAVDTAGNMGTSETKDFTVTMEESQPSEPFSTPLIVVFSVAVVAVGALVVLVYRKKR